MHGGFTPREPSWRAWIVVLAIALIGATSASAVWHETHDADQDCAVCQLRHDSVADLVEQPRIAPTDLPQSPAPAFVVRFVRSHLDARVPARAPPA